MLLACSCNLIGDSQKNTFSTQVVARDVAKDLSEPDLDASPVQDDSGTGDVRRKISDIGVRDLVAFKDIGPIDMDLDTDMGGSTFCMESRELSPVLYWSFDNSPDGLSFPNLMEEGATDAVISDSVEVVDGGIHGMAVKFNGQDSSILAPHHPNLETAEGTVALWFEKSGNIVCPDTTTGCGLFSKDALGQGVGGHFTLSLTANNALKVRLQSLDSTYELQSQPVDVTKAHHVAASFGAAGLILFLDGQQIDQNSYTGGLFDTAVPPIGNLESIGVGWSMWNTVEGTTEPKQAFFEGTIDEVLFFDRQLTLVEVQSLSDGCSD